MSKIFSILRHNFFIFLSKWQKRSFLWVISPFRWPFFSETVSTMSLHQATENYYCTLIFVKVKVKIIGPFLHNCYLRNCNRWQHVTGKCVYYRDLGLVYLTKYYGLMLKSFIIFFQTKKKWTWLDAQNEVKISYHGP